MCVAVPGRLERVVEEDGARLGEVRFGDALRRIDLMLVPEAVPGDDLIVHSGIALRRLEPGEADATLRLLDTMFETTVDR